MKVINVILATLGVLPIAHSQIQIVDSVAQFNQVNIASEYTETFDIQVAPIQLPFTPWVNNQTLIGWYSTSTGIRELGSSILSLGPEGGVGERSLGATGFTGGTTSVALRLQNLTNTIITGVNVQFDGEQWHRFRQPNGTQLASKLTFSYRIFLPGEGNVYTNDDNTQWTYVPELTFVSPNATLNTNYFFMDGNAPENSVRDIQKLVTGFNVAPGQELWLRWGSQDIPYPSSPHGLGIDNLSVSFITSVPEPANTTMLAGWIILLFTNRRWRRRPR